jgi:hypothetical protein
MKRRQISGVIAMSGLVVALAAVYAGCEKHENGNPGMGPKLATHAHNLRLARCSSQNGEGKVVKIEIDVTQKALANLDDRIVFVCPGETLHWHLSNGTFEVNFTDPNANLLFGGATNFKSQPAGGGAQADSQPVQDSGAADRTYKYIISVKDGSNVFQVDPHVIPM